MPLDPLDEHPIHQAPMSMRYVTTSDRNAYDRCIFQALDHTGTQELITGLGVYPNAGIIDAYATLRRGDRQWAVQASGVRPDDKLSQAVGPYRIEVLEPFRRIRVVCDGDSHGLGMDLLWSSDYAPMEEPQHVRRLADKVLLDGCRYAQVGSWTGEIRVDGEAIAVDPQSWTGTRDRSWGIRPVGKLELPIPPLLPTAAHGSYWVWMPLRFDDFAIHVIVEESADGTRSTNFATRVWPLETGRAPEQLGWPEIDIDYVSGTRFPVAARIRMQTPERKPVTVELEVPTAISLNVGCGYSFSGPDWSHGSWMGEQWVRGVTFDYADPEVQQRVAGSHVDHLARASCDGQVGYGVFEHAVTGVHLPSGFTDAAAMAP